MPTLRLLLASLALSVTHAASASYLSHPKTAQLHAKLKAEYQFTEQDLLRVDAALSSAVPQPKLVQAEVSNKEVTTPLWDDYRKLHVFDAQVTRGAKVIREHKVWFDKAEAEFGVPAVVIAAILGVETKYGSYTGRNRVLDALTTQGYEHPRRADYFFSELAAFFAFCKKFGYQPEDVKGSYAGAMGYAQFMPSNYLRLARDYDGDGRIDLWSMPDAIGSIAYYFTAYVPPSGIAAFWQRAQPLIAPVRVGTLSGAAPEINGKRPTATLAQWGQFGATVNAALDPDTKAGLLELRRPNGPEYWLGLPNFYSVMSYNPRVFYAMAVTQLAAEIQATVAKP
jgi:membrane-bound lytic murein transglycosylase B